MKKRKKNYFPQCLLDINNIISGLTFAVLYALVFLVIYSPYSDTAWFGTVKSDSFVLTTSFISISVFFLVLSRVLMYVITRKLLTMTYTKYVLWLLLEIIIIGVFHSFLSKGFVGIDDYSFTFILLKSIMVTFMALGIPYLVSALWLTLREMRNTLLVTDTKTVASDGEAIAQNMDIINITDNKGVLKMSVKLDNLYYIKAEDNYTIVYYKRNEMLNRYMIRCKIKTLEESFSNTPLMRCHRAYIVNTQKIKVLRHEQDGFYMDFDFAGIDPIPVSKTYSDAVVKQFSKGKLKEKLENME